MGSNEEKHSFLDTAMQPQHAKQYGCGFVTFWRFFTLFKIAISNGISATICILICVMAVLEQYLIYNVGIVPSRFYRVLGDKNWNDFWVQVLNSSLLIISLCFVLSCKQYLTNVFYVLSRELLTDKLHIMYFTKNNFYSLNTFEYSLTDNPDQRITQDIDKFCKQFSKVINPFIIAPFTISYYSYNCYQKTGYIGPLGIFLVFLLSVFFNKLLMTPITALVMSQEKCEGFFRFKHMHVRTNAESIALQGAHLSEMYRCNFKLMDLIKTQQSLYLRQFPLDVAVNIFSYMGSIISYLIVAYPIFSGMYDNLTGPELSELISKNAFVSIYLISCFSSLINVSTNLSEIGGLTHRVYELLYILDTEKQPQTKPHSDSKIILQFREDSKPAIELEDVTFTTPKKSKPLIRNLNLKINVGDNLLITGNSSSGKTSLFRVIRGIWPIQEGNIIKRLAFQPRSMFMLPQHTLLTDGSLIEQIVYPLQIPKDMNAKAEDIDLIVSYLHYVDMSYLLEKSGLFKKYDWNWYDVLSPGEAQRLSFVRLFWHRPKIAFLDEATSALGLDHETKMYEKCKELGITVISIGHRSSLAKFHSSFLHLNGEGGWSLSSEPNSQ